MMGPPYLVLAAAHSEHAKAAHAMRVCLACHSDHPLIIELQGGDLRGQADEFLDGVPTSELPLLLQFQAKLRFSFTVERLIEGQHSLINKY